ncbi:MAG: ribbon-helix-helix domain-containing protein [Nitrososphaerales archaeon]
MSVKTKAKKEGGRQDYQPIAIPRDIIEMIDKIIADGRFIYVSRNDFVRDAVRRRIEEIAKLQESETFKVMSEKAKKKE